MNKTIEIVRIPITIFAFLSAACWAIQLLVDELSGRSSGAGIGLQILVPSVVPLLVLVRSWKYGFSKIIACLLVASMVVVPVTVVSTIGLTAMYFERGGKK